ncbi:hypothetical protein V8B97DRAFT_1919430 [Scleroderma yunnanense]
MLEEDNYSSDSDHDLMLNDTAVMHDGSQADPDDDVTTLNPDDEELDLLDLVPSKPPTPSLSPIIGKKHRQGKEKMIPEEPKGPNEISYLISIFSAAKMKIKSKLSWDTLKAQILTKIVKTLKLQLIKDYTVMYYIGCILSKPGLSLAGQEDFDGLMKCMKGMPSKIPIMNIVVIQVAWTPVVIQGQNLDPESDDEPAAPSAKLKGPKCL